MERHIGAVLNQRKQIFIYYLQFTIYSIFLKERFLVLSVPSQHNAPLCQLYRDKNGFRR